MFGFGQKKSEEKINLNEIPVDPSHIQTFEPRYEYKIKIFEEDGDGRTITSTQEGIKANSDEELIGLYAMCQQKIQILSKKEINPNAVKTSPNSTWVSKTETTTIKPIEEKPQVKYFSAGGIDFKMVGDDVYQKQWIRATEEECKDIRIINDSNNKIVTLKDKHLEIQHWIKVESTTDTSSE